MKMLANSRKYLLTLCLMLTMLLSINAWASSDDNSLYDLGITTEGVTIDPEFVYSTWEYDVVVPGGTTVLELDPVASSEQATVTEVSGTTLDDEGNATVLITVTSGSGIPFTYTLHVTTDPFSAPAAAETEVQTEAQTEPQTEAQTEPQTEDSQYVKVDRNTIQEAENTITDLKGEITELRETISLYTKIMYGLIGVSVVLLFIVINLMLKKKDLKAELNDYRSYGYTPEKNSRGSAPKQEKAQRAPKKQQNRQPERGAQNNVRDEQAGRGVQNNGRGEQAGRDMQNGQNVARNASSYQPDQDLDVRPQMSRKPRTMPAYEEENVVKQAAADSKSEDAAMREAEAQKRQEAAAAKAQARSQAQAAAAARAHERVQAQEAKNAAKQEEKQRKAAAREEAARAKEEQKQGRKRGGSSEQSSSDGGVKIDMIDL